MYISLSGNVIFKEPSICWHNVFTSAVFASNKKNTCRRKQRDERQMEEDKDVNGRHVGGGGDGGRLDVG